jgi:nucleoside-diphosphate-sugar epimerase
MTVAIAGGHGKIALRLTRRLADRGETVISGEEPIEQALDGRIG